MDVVPSILGKHNLIVNTLILWFLNSLLVTIQQSSQNISYGHCSVGVSLCTWLFNFAFLLNAIFCRCFCLLQRDVFLMRGQDYIIYFHKKINSQSLCYFSKLVVIDSSPWSMTSLSLFRCLDFKNWISLFLDRSSIPNRELSDYCYAICITIVPIGLSCYIVCFCGLFIDE